MTGLGVWESPLGVDLFLLTLAGGLLILLNLRTLHHWSSPLPLPLWADLVAPVLIMVGATLLALDIGATVRAVSWLIVLAFAAAIARLASALRSAAYRASAQSPRWPIVSAAVWPGSRVLLGIALGLYPR